MLNEHQKHWGVDQWAAFLSARALPCMPRSKLRLLELETELGDSLSAHDLANLAGDDPLRIGRNDSAMKQARPLAQ